MIWLDRRTKKKNYVLVFCLIEMMLAKSLYIFYIFDLKISRAHLMYNLMLYPMSLSIYGHIFMIDYFDTIFIFHFDNFDF